MIQIDTRYAHAELDFHYSVWWLLNLGVWKAEGPVGVVSSAVFRSGWCPCIGVLVQAGLIQIGRGPLKLRLLREYAERFDAATRACSARLGVQFDDYPNGSCGAASEILAEYLHASGFGVFAYVVGRDGVRSHAWLEQGRVIVDVTAGQFEGAPEPIIISTDQSWHERFRDRDVYPDGSFKSWGDQAQESAFAYSIILEELKRREQGSV
ncbi:hypothetical protein ACFMBG_23940 [Leisingera sp. D0M16]|uniref:hypothetical protein n=1 Tax=Leisingera coralii TaxID=3351347 RepID=UPI003B81A921